MRCATLSDAHCLRIWAGRRTSQNAVALGLCILICIDPQQMCSMAVLNRYRCGVSREENTTAVHVPLHEAPLFNHFIGPLLCSYIANDLANSPRSQINRDGGRIVGNDIHRRTVEQSAKSDRCKLRWTVEGSLEIEHSLSSFEAPSRSNEASCFLDNDFHQNILLSREIYKWYLHFCVWSCEPR